MSNRTGKLAALLLACVLAVTPFVSQAGGSIVAGDQERCDMMASMDLSGHHDHAATAEMPCELEASCEQVCSACSTCSHCPTAAFLATAKVSPALTANRTTLAHHESFISAHSPQELRPPRNA